MKISTQMKTKWMQFKVSALSASITALIVSSIPTQISASDIDIYQAGGTGGVNIYLMLDASSSMGDMSLEDDYNYQTKGTTSCITQPTTVTVKAYSYSSSGRRIYYKLASGGSYNLKAGNGTNNSSRFTYVGLGKGNYDVINTDSFGYTQAYGYYRLTDHSDVVEKEVCTTTGAGVQTCPNTRTTIYGNAAIGASGLKVGDYFYAKANERYCKIDISILGNSDENYKKKITDICEKESGTVYRCLQRLSILRKGLYTLINNENIGDDIYFALGYYNANKRETHTYFTEGGKVVYRKMDADGKAKLATAIEGLGLNIGTPITYGYNIAAASHYNKVNRSSTGPVKDECSGNGIYLLTDGVPQYSNGFSYGGGETDRNSTSLSPLLEITVGGKTYKAETISTADNSYNLKDYWRNLAGNVLLVANDKSKNIKTATVGFGGTYYKNFSDAEKILNSKGNFSCDKLTDDNDPSKLALEGDLAALCYLGEKRSGYGQGGFYTAQSTNDLVESILQFVSDVSVPIEGSTMGTSTVPVDALNPTQLQNYSYFPVFKPIVGGNEQLWAGNLKKFAVKTSSGTIVDQLDKPVFKDGKIQEKLSDYWYESAGSSDDDVYMTWGGLLSKLKVYHKPFISSGNLEFKRNIYLDNDGDLKHVINDVLNDAQILEDKKHYLFGLLGYSKLTQTDFDALAGKSYDEQISYLQTQTNTQDFQMGSVIHSTPIMLTQKGVFEGEDGITGREDYILAGTTQGLVQVVDADSGKEVFSFLPSEFLTRTKNSQEKGFAESLAMSRFTTTDKDNFFYGIDAPWTAHTEYKYEFEGDKEIMTASKQYVYGGLRMGGRSYYALDLTNLGQTSGSPKLLFSIKPDNYTTGALSYMGESWSKPVITYIPWKGQKKLAMIVGGGYDRKYESQDISGDVNGNGIYIFAAEKYDANTKAGDLLWWGSSNATTSNTGNSQATKISTMTHSIPSRVKAVDRNGDGITDHLYVGDLGGQVFRVDFNSKLGASAANTPLVYQAVKIADLNTTGNYPRRFYEAPTFTIHKDDNGKRFAIVTLASGDRSSPLITETNYPQDYIIALKDDTVTQTPVAIPTLITLASMHDITSSTAFNKGTDKGWFYPMPKSNGKQSRGIEEGVALDNDLYYSLFNPDASTATEDGADKCTGGVTGKSTVYKFCLPYGDKTCFGTTTLTNPEKIGDLGAGIIGLTLGAGRSKATNRTLIFNKDVDFKPTEYAVTDKLVPKRWFEYLPFNSGGK